MNRQSGSINIIIIFILGCLLAAGLYWFRPKPEIRPISTPKPPLVSVINLSPQKRQISVDTQGTVTASRRIDLTAEVAGRVVSVNTEFVNGGFVKQGDVIVSLDDRDYQYQLVTANANVAVAERELALEKGQARQAKREWRDLGSVEANALSLRLPQVAAAEAQLRSAIAERDQAQLTIERTRLRAPFDGRISQTNVNLGQFVSAGTVIASLSDSSLAEVRLPLTDKQLALVGLPLGVKLSEGQQKAVTLSAKVAGQDYQWPAMITRTEASVDSSTRFYFAVAQIPEPYNQARYDSPLLTGLFVKAQIAGRELEKVIAIPELSVLDNRLVYIVNQDDRLEHRQIEVLARDNSNLWVAGDLHEGDTLVVSDPRVLQPQLVVTKKLIQPKQ